MTTTGATLPDSTLSLGRMCIRSSTILDTTTSYTQGFADGDSAGFIRGIATIVNIESDDMDAQTSFSINAGLSASLQAAEADVRFLTGRLLGTDTGFALGSAITTDTMTTSASIISLAPADGSMLSPDPELARWIPVVATLQCESGHKPYVFVTIGSLRWTIYDGSQDKISPFFGDHTVVTNLGSDQFTISVLPNGGWWRSNIDIRFVSGVELV